MLLIVVEGGGVSITFIFCRIGKGRMLLRDGSDKGGIPDTSPALMVGKADNSVTEKVGSSSDVGAMEIPPTVESVGKGPVSGMGGKGRTLLMEGSNKGEIGSAVRTGSVGKGPVSGMGGKGRTLLMEGSNKGEIGSAVRTGSVGKGPVSGMGGKGRTLLMEGSDNGGIGSAVRTGSVGKGPSVGATGKGRTLMIEEGGNSEMGSSVGVGSASIGLPVACGFKRPSERRKQTRSLQPKGRLVAAVGAGESKRLSESTTQSRESHVRGSAEDADTGEIANVDGVVAVAGVVRGFKSPEVPGPLGITAGGGGNQCGGGFNGKLGLRGGSGARGIHGLLGFKGGNRGGGIHGLGCGGGGAGGKGGE